MTWVSKTFVNISTTNKVIIICGITCASPSNDGIGTGSIGITVVATVDTIVDISTSKTIYRITSVTFEVESSVLIETMGIGMT